MNKKKRLANKKHRRNKNRLKARKIESMAKANPTKRLSKNTTSIAGKSKSPTKKAPAKKAVAKKAPAKKAPAKKAVTKKTAKSK